MLRDIILLYIFCANTEGAAVNHCLVDVQSRTACPTNPTSQSTCTDANCCWDATVTPNCYNTRGEQYVKDVCTVAAWDRRQCHTAGVTETTCVDMGCCYDSASLPKCYYSTAEVPGFIRFRGDTHSPNLWQVSVASHTECATLCMDRANCDGFIYGFPGMYATNALNCWLKSGWEATLRTDDPKYRYLWFYMRQASAGYSCDIGDCLGYDVGNNLQRTYAQCRAACEAEPSCVAYTMLYTNCYTKTKLCKAHELDNRHDVGHCHKGYVEETSRGLVNYNLPAQTLQDGNSATCVSVPDNSVYYRTRHPFPLLDTTQLVVKVTAQGSGLTCGTNTRVYFPRETQHEARFTGYFRYCDVITGNSTLCEFRCACYHGYCEALYSQTEGTASLCELTFSSA